MPAERAADQCGSHGASRPAALFVGLALLAAIPLVLLLHVTQRHQDDRG
jgi:hypothetical protein